MNNGVPIEHISKMLGHKSIRTTQRYCRVNKAPISESMNKVRNTLFDQFGKFRRAS
nr:tyrosine-type recombinase/integrase [Pedobacter sp. ASV19]